MYLLCLGTLATTLQNSKNDHDLLPNLSFFIFALNLLSKTTTLTTLIHKVPSTKSLKNLSLSVRLSKQNSFSSFPIMSLQSDSVVDSFSLKQKPCVLILPISMVVPKKFDIFIIKIHVLQFSKTKFWLFSTKRNMIIIFKALHWKFWFYFLFLSPKLSIKNSDFYLQRSPPKVLIFHL